MPNKSKRQRREQKRRERQARQAHAQRKAEKKEPTDPRRVITKPAEYKGGPTPERLAKGGIAKGDATRPSIASDALRQLRDRGDITEAQEEAGREFGRLGDASRRSMGIRGVKSCLAGGVGGHDEGDGQEGIEEAWREMCRKLTIQGRIALEYVAIEGVIPNRTVRWHAIEALRALAPEREEAA